MRTFIVVGHKATTSPNFSLEDIPGTSGRLDILCRCINGAFVLSHGIRHDAQIYLILLGGEKPKILWLRGEDLKHLNPDERTTAALLKKALALEAGPEWTKSTPGIFVRSGGLPEMVESIKALGSNLKYLREDGTDIRGAALPDGSSFILGDHVGMAPEEESLLKETGAEIISLGLVSLHSDHCIVIINNELDRREKKSVT